MGELQLLAEIKFVKGVIEFDKEKIKNEVIENIKKYDNLVIVDEKEIKEFKDIRANLNKVIKEIDDKRKLIKAQYSEPLTIFEKDVKEITGIINDVNAKIDVQIKEYEESQKQKKLELVKEYISKYNLDEYENLIFKNEWLNKTYSITTIDEELENISNKINTELLAIENFSTSNIEKAELLNDYKKTLDLASVMQNYNERKLVIKSVVDDNNKEKHTITLEISATIGEMEMIKDLMEKLQVEYRRIK